MALQMTPVASYLDACSAFRVDFPPPPPFSREPADQRGMRVDFTQGCGPLGLGSMLVASARPISGGLFEALLSGVLLLKPFYLEHEKWTCITSYPSSLPKLGTTQISHVVSDMVHDGWLALRLCAVLSMLNPHLAESFSSLAPTPVTFPASFDISNHLSSSLPFSSFVLPMLVASCQHDFCMNCRWAHTGVQRRHANTVDLWASPKQKQLGAQTSCERLILL